MLTNLHAHIYQYCLIRGKSRKLRKEPKNVFYINIVGIITNITQFREIKLKCTKHATPKKSEEIDIFL